MTRARFWSAVGGALGTLALLALIYDALTERWDPVTAAAIEGLSIVVAIATGGIFWALSGPEVRTR